MPNNIALSKNYVPMLDEVYKEASVTSVLDSDAGTVRAGANSNEILVAKLNMDGLKDYSRNSGYSKGDVKLEWETLKYNYDRGIKFEVDTMDNEETIELSFGRLGAEFMRTKVAPETDAVTISSLAKEDTKAKTETLATGEQVLESLRAIQSEMDEDEVPAESRHLFITPTLLRLARSVDKHKDKGVLDDFASIKKTPQSRMYTAIELLNNEADKDNNMKGGYKKATGASDINFLIVEKSAVIKHGKHIANDIIRPEDNQTSDAYMQKYRKYGIVDVYENKTAGIRCSHKGVS